MVGACTRCSHNHTIRDGVARAAADRYGYSTDRIESRLYVGKFAAPKHGSHEKRIRAWAATQHVSAGLIADYGLRDVVTRVQSAAHSQYRDNPILVTMKAWRPPRPLSLRLPDDVG